MDYFDGVGYLYWDWLVTFLAILTGFIHMGKLAFYGDRYNNYFKIGRVISGIGFFTWGIRFFIELWGHGDPKIALPGLISIIFILVGTLIINIFGNTEDKE